MKKLSNTQMESTIGGVNCFLWGIFSVTTPGIIFNLVDHLSDGDSYIADCWNS